jgi:hypothetical protein
VVVESVLEPDARPLFCEGLTLRFIVEPDEVSAIDGLVDAKPNPVTASELLGSQKTEPVKKDRANACRSTATGGR